MSKILTNAHLSITGEMSRQNRLLQHKYRQPSKLPVLGFSVLIFKTKPTRLDVFLVLEYRQGLQEFM